jgi:hypothetical protein
VMRGLAIVSLATLVLATGLTGCKKRDSGDMPICATEVAGGTAVESEVRELSPDIWYSIMLQGFDRDRMLAGDDPKDCTGTSTLTPTPPPVTEGEEPPEDPTMVAGCKIGGDPAADRLPARPLTPDDIVISEGPDNMSLVWVQATHYKTGEASGPVAMVQWTKAGIAVRALGTLRAHTKKAQMHIEVAGDQRILFVKGEECNLEESKVCKQVARLLPIINGRFVTVPLKLAAEESQGADVCLGDAVFALSEQYTSNLPDGKVRKFEIVRSIDFKTGTPKISEVVKITDADPTQPDAKPEPFREANQDRMLVYKDRYFETRGSLWEDMLQEHGSVAHTAAEEE